MGLTYSTSYVTNTGDLSENKGVIIFLKTMLSEK